MKCLSVLYVRTDKSTHDELESRLWSLCCMNVISGLISREGYEEVDEKYTNSYTNIYTWCKQKYSCAIPRSEEVLAETE